MKSIDRRAFLGASTATILGLPSMAEAQQGGVGPSTPDVTAAAIAAGDRKTLSEVIADFVSRFELKDAPPVVIERARIAFIDTIGVMLAGSQLPPSDIVLTVRHPRPRSSDGHCAHPLGLPRSQMCCRSRHGF
jgi:hypothetical protein